MNKTVLLVNIPI